jgi:hypothetical protein
VVTLVEAYGLPPVPGDWGWLEATEPTAALLFRQLFARPGVNPSLYANFTPWEELDRFAFWRGEPGMPADGIVAYSSSDGRCAVWDGGSWSTDPNDVDRFLRVLHAARFGTDD